MSVFNTNQVNHHEQPLFLGEDTGVARYDDPKHTMFEKLTEKQLSFFWRPEEISLAEDRAQFQAMDPVWQAISTNNLKYQTLLDSVQGRAPSLAFMDICSDVGFETWIATWTFSETIHSRSYTHIMRNVYPDPGKEFETIVLNEAIMKRANSVAKYYDQLEEDKALWKAMEMNRKIDVDILASIDFELAIEDSTTDRAKLLEKRAVIQAGLDRFMEVEYTPTKRALMRSIYLCMHSVNTLEAIRFYVSFACTFNFHKNVGGIMEGNTKIMKLIARDEQLHLVGTQYTINYLASGKEGQEWADVAKECEDEATQIFIDVANQEKEWIDYLFKDGTVPGLNHEILGWYVEYITNTRMNAVNLKSPFKARRHPIPWIRGYLNSEAVQVAPQEVEISSYLVGQVDQDITEEHFHKFKKYL